MTPRDFNWLDIVRRESATVTVLKVATRSEWVGFNVLPDTIYVISRMAFTGKIADTHNNETKSLTFTKNSTFIKHKTQKNDLNLKL